jgi:hypothetical protein
MQDKIEFRLFDRTNTSVFGHLFEISTGEFAGTAQGSLGLENELVSSIKIHPIFKNKGCGFFAFKKIFDILSENNDIGSIVGGWYKDEEFSHLEGGKSTNLLVFEQNLDNGLSPEDAAANTPTGKWAKRLGFKKVEVVRANSSNVEVVFMKDIQHSSLARIRVVGLKRRASAPTTSSEPMLWLRKLGSLISNIPVKIGGIRIIVRYLSAEHECSTSFGPRCTRV